MRREAPVFGRPAHPEFTDQNQQDYPTQISKALALQARVPGELTPRIGCEITIDDFTRPEFQFLRRRQLWDGRVTRAGTAANFGYAVLQGRAGTMVVVTKLIISNFNLTDAAYFVGLATANANFTNGASAPRDSRLVGQTPVASIYSGVAVAPTQPQGKVVYVKSHETLQLDTPWVMPNNPGTALQVVDSVANQIIDVSFEWSERAVLETEIL